MATTTRTFTATQAQTPARPRAVSRVLYPAVAPNGYSETEPIAHYSSDGNAGGVTDVTATVTPPFAQTLRTLQVKNVTAGTLASMDAYMPLAYGPAATAGLPYTFTLRVQPGPGAGQRSAYAIIEWYNGATHLVNNSGTPLLEAASGWTQLTVTATAPATATHALVAMFMAAVPAGEAHYASAWQWTQTAAPVPYIGQGGTVTLAKAGARTVAPTQGQTPKLVGASASSLAPAGQAATPAYTATPVRTYATAGQSMTTALASAALARGFAPTQAATPTMQGVVPPRTFTRTQSQSPSLVRAPTRVLYPAQATNTYPELEPIGRYGSDSGNAGGVTDVTATVTPPFAQTLRTLQIKNMTAGTLVSLDAYIVTGWQADWPAATPGQTYTFTVWVQGAGGVQRNATLLIEWFNGPTHLVNIQGATVMEAASGWTRVTVTGTAPATTTHALLVVYISAVPVGEAHYASAWQFTQTAAPVPYFGQGGATALTAGALARTFAPTQSATPRLARTGVRSLAPAGQAMTPVLTETAVRSYLTAGQSATLTLAMASARALTAGQSAAGSLASTGQRQFPTTQSQALTRASADSRAVSAAQAQALVRAALGLRAYAATQAQASVMTASDARVFVPTQAQVVTMQGVVPPRTFVRTQAQSPALVRTSARTFYPAQAPNLYPELEVIGHYSSDGNAGGVTDVTASVTPPFAQTQRTLQVKNGSAGTLGWMDAYRSWVYGPMVTPGQPYTFSVWVQPGPGAARRFAYCVIEWFNGSTHLYNAQMATVLEAASGWTQLTISDVAPATATQVLLAAFIGNVPAGEVHYASAWQFTQTAVPVPYIGQSGAVTRTAAALSHALGATQSQTPTLKRSVGHGISTSQSASPAEGRTLGRSLAVAGGAAVSRGPQARARAFSAPQSQGVARGAASVARALAASQAAGAALTRTVARGYAATQAAGYTVRCSTSRAVGATQAAATAVVRAVTAGIAASQGQTAFLAARQLATEHRSTQVQGVMRQASTPSALSVTQGQASGYAVAASRPFNVTQASAATTVRALAGTATASQAAASRIVKGQGRIVKVAGSCTLTLLGGVERTMAGAQDQVLSTQYQVARVAAVSQAAAGQLGRGLSAGVSLTQDQFGVFTTPPPLGTLEVAQWQEVHRRAAVDRRLAAGQLAGTGLQRILSLGVEATQAATALIRSAVASVVSAARGQNAGVAGAPGRNVVVAGSQRVSRAHIASRTVRFAQSQAAGFVGVTRPGGAFVIAAQGQGVVRNASATRSFGCGQSARATLVVPGASTATTFALVQWQWVWRVVPRGRSAVTELAGQRVAGTSVGPLVRLVRPAPVGVSAPTVTVSHNGKQEVVADFDNVRTSVRPSGRIVVKQESR